jgi:hypothetical protein
MLYFLSEMEQTCLLFQVEHNEIEMKKKIMTVLLVIGHISDSACAENRAE